MTTIELVEIKLSPEDRARLRALIEVCDDQAIVNRTLIERGYPMSIEAGQLRFYPYGDGDWFCLACVGGGGMGNAILRLPKSAGDIGPEFLLSYMHYVCSKEGNGVLTVGLQDTSGGNN